MTGEAERMAQMWRWLEAVCAELEIDPELLDGVTDELLGLVRDVAHGPSRPGAPLTAFLVGLAVGRSSPDLSAAAVVDRVAAVERLAASWPAR